MTLEPIYPSAEEVARLLAQHGLFVDEWVREPMAIAAKMQRSMFWAIRVGRRVVGLVWLSDIVPESSASVHIMVKKEYKRYCRPKRVKRKWTYDWHSPGKANAYTQLLDFVFDDLKCRRLTTATPLARRASQRLAQRLGFKREGDIRQAVSINGRLDDLIVWGMVRQDYEDWKEKHGEQPRIPMEPVQGAGVGRRDGMEPVQRYAEPAGAASPAAW